MSAATNVLITKTRKRGRDEVDESEVDARAFTIKPDSSDPFAAPRTFTPICLLSRAQLPLAYLDTASSGSRLFSAHVNALEAAHDHDDDATVLVAAETKEMKLYAIERVKRRMYALCRLGDWVKEEDVLARSKCVLREESQVKRRVLKAVEKGKPWWMSAAVDMPDVPSDVTEGKPKLDMKAALMQRKEDSIAPVCEHQPLNSGPERPMPEDGEAVQSATDVMQDLARHYLEALYLSRTSLAYFTKGPLSRARAAFNAMPGPTATSELVGFLRESILTSSAMDKKFKDHISSTVKDMSVGNIVSPEQPKKTKRKRKWKPKRDKHGFFTDEKGVVEKWWLDYDTSTSSTETVEDTLRRRLPKLRSRETFMQLIMILEALALEASMPIMPERGDDTQATTTVETQTDETQQNGTKGDTGEEKSRPKKKQDLPALLETLLDKLCIWHSLESHSPAKKAGAEADGQDEPSNELRSFCVEVIVPFYVSRIPQHAALVNKKLGGPTAPTPVKRKSAPTRKPGEPAVRRAPEKKPRKPLARVGTDTLDRHSRPLPSLHRSATDTDALSLYIKRETSESPMESIPAINQPRKPRQSLMHTLDSSRRQVDLNAMSQANDAKLQRKADMQEKMQSAINMLRKPNRAAALAEIRDQTDESFAKATAAAKGRSSGACHKVKSAQRGQIEAPPSHRRIVKATPFKRAAEPSQPERLLSSGTTHVPSSSARLAQTREVPPASSFTVPQTGHRPRHCALEAAGVEETPSRGFAKFMPPGLAREPGTLDSPTVSRKIAATPSKPVRSLSLGVSATPALVAVSPNLQRHQTNATGEAPASKSIYDSLGWDEDEYEELT